MSDLRFGEEPLEDVAYLHDGSLEGLLSSVFCSFSRHEQPTDIICERRYQPRLGQARVRIDTDFDQALRVRRGVVRRAGSRAFLAIMRASACDDYDTGTTVLGFVRYVVSHPGNACDEAVLDQLACPAVSALVRLEKRAVNECEKMGQFIRFSQTEGGVWFARCNPEASVVPLVMNHFAGRMGGQPFVIYDERRNLAGIHDGVSWELVTDVSLRQPTTISPREREMQEAWKRLYDALSNDARYNPDLRRHFMPVRLWRNLTEMQPRNGKAPGFDRNSAERERRGRRGLENEGVRDETGGW